MHAGGTHDDQVERPGGRARIARERHAHGGRDHVHHTDTLGAAALLLGALLLVGAATMWTWYRRTERGVALALYLLLSLWIVVGFGLVNGLWGSTFRVFLGSLLTSVSSDFPKPALGGYGFEMSGIVIRDSGADPVKADAVTSNASRTGTLAHGSRRT